MRVSHATFPDPYNGSGYRITAHFQRGHVLLAARWRWQFRIVRAVQSKPGYSRLYVGPLEVEVARYGRAQQQGGRTDG